VDCVWSSLFRLNHLLTCANRLHISIQNGHKDFVSFLLKNGSNIEALTARKWTPLFVGCWKNRVEIVKMLLEMNCQVNVVDEEHWSLLHTCGMLQHPFWPVISLISLL